VLVGSETPRGLFRIGMPGGAFLLVKQGRIVMKIVEAEVGPFRSINRPQTVQVEKTATALVGMNEAGKTVFLKALEKSGDALGLEKFTPVEDYPRKDLSAYLKKHKDAPEAVTTITYEPSAEELAQLNKALSINVPKGFRFTVTHKYNNTRSIGINIDEHPAIDALAKQNGLSTDAAAHIHTAKTIRSIPDLLKAISITEADKAFLDSLVKRISKAEWESVIQWEAWKWLEARLPKFLYFGEYELLPSKMNLSDLAARVERSKSDPNTLTSGHRAVLALLRMADISLSDFSSTEGYETLKAKIESVSIRLTDQIMAFWKQNETLEVEIDIKPDPKDDAPFNQGPNLYLRIRNRRHRGVSTPFQQRSRGFIWFFSFLVWFDSVQQQIDGDIADNRLVLLLDEPGLSLHALAQRDFLKYIDELSQKHQVIYTTHSPFMVHSDRLGQVRVVEDLDGVGTVVSDNISGSDPRTIFPLQAALGWNIAQNLFISERNLLVEGTSDMIYLDTVSSILNQEGAEGLRDDVTIVPTGGLDKVATFVALLSANELRLAVLHDYRGTTDQRLLDLVKEKLISSKAVLNVSQFRDTAAFGQSGQSSDIEDLFDPPLYLEYFTRAFAKQLKGVVITEADLPPGDRIVDRIERYLNDQGIKLRQSGGFNHHTVAACFSASPPRPLGAEAKKRFERLFATVNELYGLPASGRKSTQESIAQKIEPVMREAISEISREEVRK
jgi:hypothetical protein